MNSVDLVIKIREQAEENYYKYLDDNFQPILDPLVKELQKRYPKRNIYMVFGNGGCVVNFGGVNNYNSHIDHYGNLNSWLQVNNKKYFDKLGDNHPLVLLMKVMDELYDMKGYVPYLKDIK